MDAGDWWTTAAWQWCWGGAEFRGAGTRWRSGAAALDGDLRRCWWRGWKPARSYQPSWAPELVVEGGDGERWKINSAGCSIRLSSGPAAPPPFAGAAARAMAAADSRWSRVLSPLLVHCHAVTHMRHSRMRTAMLSEKGVLQFVFISIA
ncbi:hypothetical protein ABZP36_022332 [Zizania latifolia]